jgi:RES domain-containing protein
MKLFRIAKGKHVGVLSGVGARLYGGRWNDKGVAVVYTSESRALAALEYLVHVPMSTIPIDLQMMELNIPEWVIPDTMETSDLPSSWRKYPSPQSLATLGSNWAHSKRSLLLRVPSAVVGNEYNVLINPNHEDIKLIQVIGPVRFEFDSRLLRL